jgi:glycosyltransferase involved in cell wall biosynthesis
LRILINAVGAAKGGAARHLAPFLQELVVLRPEWRLDVFVTRGALAWFTPPAGACAHEVRRAGPVQRLPWDTREVATVAAELGADTIVNLANYGPASASVPSILYQRNSLYFDPAWLASRPLNERVNARLRRALAYRQMAASAAVVVPSYAMASCLRAWSAWDPRTLLRVVPHGVDTERFAFRPQATQPSRPVRLLNVSHGAPYKDFEVALHLLARLRAQGVDASLVLTASPSDGARYFRTLETVVRQLDLARHVNLLGQVGDVERLYGECDVFISTSRTESFGFPLLEAMASGVPVVASAIPSSIEVLAGHGELFLPGDAGAAANAVRRVLDLAAAARSERVDRARQWAEAHSWQRNASELAAIVEEVTGA